MKAKNSSHNGRIFIHRKDYKLLSFSGELKWGRSAGNTHTSTGPSPCPPIGKTVYRTFGPQSFPMDSLDGALSTLAKGMEGVRLVGKQVKAEIDQRDAKIGQLSSKLNVAEAGVAESEKKRNVLNQQIANLKIEIAGAEKEAIAKQADADGFRQTLSEVRVELDAAKIASENADQQLQETLKSVTASSNVKIAELEAQLNRYDTVLTANPALQSLFG